MRVYVDNLIICTRKKSVLCPVIIEIEIKVLASEWMVLCGWFNSFSQLVLVYVNSFMKITSVRVFRWNVLKNVDYRFPGRR